MLEKTITSNNKVRANPQYPIVAGVDNDNVPRLVKTDEDGRIDLGGVILPEWDSVLLAYFAATNNLQTAIYKLSGNEVARFTFTYIGGGAADNDRLATATFSKP